MIEYDHNKIISAVFITFSGNCKKALSFYQTCFGGLLQFETFEKKVNGYTEMPIVSGSLISDTIIIHGSDLVHNEGRKLGNYISIFLHCKNSYDRDELVNKLEFARKNFLANNYDDQKLIEITDAFDVRWVLGI
ncbi:glyoxalase [Pedobacter ginsengisoli]|uniref:Glyoxalase n=1 Tax=Pedobacter ginsengisoli TaxID=363852 RepID=A0A2D1U624_9SPHI|nr:glyoxalase [Pedobacter ginsengisoli]ATP57042.1 glyoxalase [Pedobacter ginsengisoli]